MKRVLIVLVTTAFLVAVGVLINYGYQEPWTGLPASTSSDGTITPAKTLWDWLDLFIVPLFLAIAAFMLDGSRKRSEQRVEGDRQRQQTLDQYFDCITQLLIDGKLAQDSTGPARSIARTRTLAALRLLDGGRKAQLLQFIYEAGLISNSPIIQLNGADLNDADLDQATLAGSELRGVFFCRASLRNANLSGADLRGSDFSEADMAGAILENANLLQARLRRANLADACLVGANTDQVDITSAKPKKIRLLLSS